MNLGVTSEQRASCLVKCLSGFQASLCATVL
jgi:hypothetical protein